MNGSGIRKVVQLGRIVVRKYRIKRWVKVANASGRFVWYQMRGVGLELYM
jgi:hypothetical protein